MSNFSDITVSRVQSRDIVMRCRQEGYDYVVNPYIGCPNPCKYCYASFMRRFARHKEVWGEFLDVKDVSDIDTSKLKGKQVLVGSVTEPYNIFEKKYKVTRALLKILSKVDCSVTILTKSDIVLRDMDILKKMSDVKVALSLSTLDEEVAKIVEPSYSVSSRLKTIEKLHKNGIKTIVNISPIMPFITDPIAIIERTKDFADDYIFESLTLRNEFKPAMINYVYDKFPEHFLDYNRIFRDPDFSIFEEISQELEEYCAKNHIKHTNLIKF